MTARELIEIGYSEGPALGAALKAGRRVEKQLGLEATLRELRAVLDDPVHNATHEHFSAVAELLRKEIERPEFVPRAAPASYRVWGEGLESEALKQMEYAAQLPVAVSGALMPDAHLGYGLPIGGVLATDNAVIPYAVGVDIACRMRLSVYDIPAEHLKRLSDQLERALQQETVFGTGAQHRKPLDHPVLDEDWSFTSVTKRLFDTKARGQLGTSGSGNHFVEFGFLTLDQPEIGIAAGKYLALLSHSGSRGSGAMVADFYSKLAMDRHPELPPQLRRLAWLDLDSSDGQEYWLAMSLMGRYAAANHEMIHKKIAKAIGAEVIAGVENHHNFAWKETHDGRNVVVHRKGATPAGLGVLGVVPGSMATPGYVAAKATLSPSNPPATGRDGECPAPQPENLSAGTISKKCSKLQV